MIDIIFLTLPRLELRSPITAPALLKASVEQHGFKAFCYDLNLDLWNELDESKYGHIWFDTDLTFRYEDKFDQFWNDVILPHTKRWCNIIREKNPKWIGMTIFSQRSKWISIAIAKLIRKEFPNIKLVAGGPYAEYTGKLLYNHKLIDAYVVGEGEHAIVNILNGDLNHPGINGRSPEQIEDLDTLPAPDYSDFDFSKYPKTWYDPRKKEGNGNGYIYITGSRGCVRKCEFCDIASIWPKYRYRSGKKIAEEMLTQYTKYNCDKFIFTDSLINGSVKQLIELCESLVEFKNNGLLGDIKWQGQFIARPEKQMPESVYKLMQDAGCFFVSIGIESGSEKVRNHMKKMFSNEDLDFTLKMCAKYNIEMSWLLLVGYPTEDEDDFQETLNLLEKYNWINEKKLVASIALGPTLDITPGSPLFNSQQDLGIVWDQFNNWVRKDNTKVTRINRWFRLKEKCIELNYTLVEKATEHLMTELEKYKDVVLNTSSVISFNQIAGSMSQGIKK